jgi:hypothetical protein
MAYHLAELQFHPRNGFSNPSGTPPGPNPREGKGAVFGFMNMPSLTGLDYDRGGTDIRHLIHPQISRTTQNKSRFKVLGSTRHGGQEFEIVGA